MGSRGTKAKLKIALVVIGIYIFFSLLTGAALVISTIASFGAGFAVTAVWVGGLCWIISRDWR